MKVMKLKIQQTTPFNDKDSVTKWDWVFFILTAFICFILFTHEDIVTTGDNSLTFFMSLKPWEFYTNNFNWYNGYAANYMPTIYILFAIWNLPLWLIDIVIKIFGGTGIFSYAWSGNSLGVMYYYKLLPILIFIATGMLLYRLCTSRLFFSKEKAHICMFMFFSSPFAFFSQFIFCQYDIFTVFFMVCGLFYYFKEEPTPKDYMMFSLFFGFALTCKYFAAVVWAVLILVRIKDIPKIIYHGIICISPFVVEFIVYFVFDRENFIANVIKFPALDFVKSGYEIAGMSSIRLMPFVLILIIAYAYFSNTKTFDEIVQTAIYVACGVCFCFFGLMTFYPQWIIFGVVFWTLGTCISKHPEKFLWIDILTYVVFIIFVVNIFKGGVDENLLNKGILFSILNRKAGHTKTFSSMFGFLSKESNVSLLYTCFVGALLVDFLFKHPRLSTRISKDFEAKKEILFISRVRLVITALFFTLPALLCLPSMLKADDMLWKRMIYAYTSQATGEYFSEEIRLKEEDSLNTISVSQIVTINGKKIKEIGLMMYFKEASLDSKLGVQIFDSEDNLIGQSINDFRTLLCNGDLDVDFIIQGNNLVKIGFGDGISVVPDTQYRIEVWVDSNELDERIALYRDYNEVVWDDTTYRFDYTNDNAIIDGDSKNYNICMQIIGVGDEKEKGERL